MGQNTEITAADGHVFNAYAAGAADAPRALVVVQEIFGVNAHMHLVSDRLAAAGYQVLSPALFDRAERGVELPYDKSGIEHGLKLRAEIKEESVLADVEACARALALDGRKVGIIGYCWGGSVAWMGATRSHLFAAASGWYGGGIVQSKDASPHCPVQLHFGETDESIPMKDVDAIRAAQPNVEIFTYADAGHGFGCEERASYNPEATKLAEHRSLAFFATHL